MSASLNNLYRRINSCDNCQMFETVLDFLPEPIVIVNEEGYIVFFNKAYQDYLNVPREEAVGKYVADVIENTRMHLVCKGNAPEIDYLQKIHNKEAVVQRIPITFNGEVIGGIGKVNYQNVSEITALIKKLKKMEDKLSEYKNSSLEHMKAVYTFDHIIGNSEKINSAKETASKIASTDLNVLILGYTGVGKELFAHAIHNSSPRHKGPFIGINCAAIPHDLLESELFGYEEGAFTGAKKKGKPGKFEMADGGTILLDEIGDMPLSMQAKILRVLQNKQIERIGGSSPKEVDVRIVASTNQDLKQKIINNEFREDLFYRLNAAAITVPPLRERVEDIPPIIEVLLKKLDTGKVITASGMNLLTRYHWPGNVRELINVLERLIYLTDEDTIKAEHVKNTLSDLMQPESSETPSTAPSPPSQGEEVEEDSGLGIFQKVHTAEKEALLQALNTAKGNKTQAAKLLGIHRTTLYQKLKKYEIH